MLREKQRLKVTIQYVDEEGNGIAIHQKDRIFIPSVIAKEVVEVEIVKRLKLGYSAKVIQVIQGDKQRCKPLCPIFNKCGSCHLQHMSVDAQATWKRDVVKRLVNESKLKLKVADVISSEKAYGYRNKMIISFSKDKQGIQAGFYEEYSHRIVSVDRCLLHDDESNKLIQDVVGIVKKLRIEPYLEDRHRGLLRHILIRKAMVTQELMVVIVTSQLMFPARKQFVEAIRKANPHVKTIIQNINPRSTSIVLGNDEKVLFGKGYIEDELCGNTYRISSSSFYQINHDQTEVLYQKAISLLQGKGNETVLDTYCGIGTIGMSLAKHVKKVIGVEQNKQAVKDAIQNASRNHLNNIQFVEDDATHFMQNTARSKMRVDAVIMDPPRSGSTPEFIKACASLKPRAIVYISCNPKTQIRDLKVFQQVGYEGKEMLLVDLFPFTNHVETVVLLSWVDKG